jgi:tRNA (adenine22-N1)-methyltransferase
MTIPKISKRLEAAASLVRRGARIADIGTDHAYLPIYLYTRGEVSGGVVSDINRGPVDRAKANLRDYGCENAFCAQRADGLSGVLEHEIDDIFILGMGGELIARIIEDEPALRNARYRLILQPMTHPELLREYLFSSGFEVIEELLVDEGKIYQIMCVKYTGVTHSEDKFELLFGRINLSKRSAELSRLLEKTRETYLERVKGKLLSGACCDYENDIIEKIDKFLQGEN